MRWWKKPDPGTFDFDWTHPSAERLLFYLPFTDQASPPRNIVSPNMVGSFSGATNRALLRPTVHFGWGIRPTAAESLQVSNPKNINAAAGDFMIRLLFRPDSWPGGFSAIISKADSSTSRELCLFVDTSGNLSFYGVGETSNAIAIATGMTAGLDWDFVWARKGVVNTAYVNGASKGTWNDGSSNPDTGTNVPWIFGAQGNGGGNDADATYAGIQFWQRAPYNGEVLALYNDPFGMLRPRIQRRYVIPPAAGAAAGYLLVHN